MPIELVLTILPLAGYFVFKIIRVFNEGKTLLVMREEAIASILLHRTKRLNLIGQILRLVKSYGLHERNILEGVSESFGRDGKGENTHAVVARIAALHMHFPEIKAQTLYSETLAALESTESQLENARNRVNKISKSFNTLIATFPNNFFSMALGFSSVDYLTEQSIGLMEEELRNLADGKIA